MHFAKHRVNWHRNTDKILSILILQLLVSSTTFSQDFWEKIDIPPGQVFSSVSSSNAGHIYLGSYKTNGVGGVFMTENGGVTWNSIGIENYSVYSLSLNHEGNLLAGINGHIYLYVFSQQSWDMKHASLTNFISISPGIPNTFFAGGATINRSFNDGYTWEEITDMGENGVYDITVKSIDTVYMGTTNFLGGGGVYQSIDGGDTWQNIGLEDHYITTVGLNSQGDLFAGSIGHYYFGVGGLYKLQSGSSNWDTLMYWPRIRTMVITEADIIYCGYWGSTESRGGVMHSNDNGETWIIDTSGMGNVGISKLVINSNETLYALSSTTQPSKLYQSSLPVSVNNTSTLRNYYNTFCSPNPFNSSTIIFYQKPKHETAQFLLNIYDQNGRKLITRALNKFETDQREVLIERTDLKAGLYIYTISGEKYKCAGKFLIIN